MSLVLAWDDLTGMKLESVNVEEARGKEIEYVRDMHVYDKIPRHQAVRSGWEA